MAGADNNSSMNTLNPMMPWPVEDLSFHVPLPELPTATLEATPPPAKRKRGGGGDDSPEGIPWESYNHTQRAYFSLYDQNQLELYVRGPHIEASKSLLGRVHLI